MEADFAKVLEFSYLMKMSTLPSRHHFGDLLGTGKPGLEEDVLARFNEPLDRLILTADGTLQVLVSSWHSRVVQVKVLRHEPRKDGLVYDREIELVFADDLTSKAFCNAKSVVTYESLDLVQKAEGFGIGQLFRAWNILPRFELLDAGKSLLDETMWRKYRLFGEGIECVIHETFPRNPFKLDREMKCSPPGEMQTFTKALSSDARYMDILPPSMSPVQRIFCTANGNVQRLASALLGEPVDVKLLEEKAISTTEFRRVVELTGSKSQTVVCNAKSKILIENGNLLELIHAKRLNLGSLVKEIGVYPTFQLHSAKWTSPQNFTRHYSLEMHSKTGLVLIELEESFHWDRHCEFGMLSQNLSNLSPT